MRKLLIATISTACLALSSAASADSQIVYASKAECKAVLADLRIDNPLYWLVECRPVGNGWIFSTIDKGDQPKLDPNQP